MKKILLSLAVIAACAGNAAASPKAVYVNQGNSYTKFNLGAAGNMEFSDSGKKMTITGYGEVVDLDKIDYITFTAPIDDNALSPGEQKEKLLQIGQEFVNKFDLKKCEDLILMIDRFSRYDSDADRDPASEYEWPHEFWDVHNEFKAAMKAAGSIAKGSPAAVRALRSATVNLYKLSDYFGVYTANSRTEEWEKTADADYFEMRFAAADGDFYKVRLEAGNDTSRWDTSDANIELAKEINVTFMKANDKIATAKVTSNLVQDKSITMNIIAEAGGYVVTSDMEILNDGITDKLNVTCDGQYLMSADTKVDGKNLLIYDEMYDAIKEATHYHDADDNCCGEDPSELIAHVFRGNTSADVLGKLQVKGKAYNLSKLYDTLGEEDDEDDYILEGHHGVYFSGNLLFWNPETREMKYSYDDMDYYEKAVKYLNNYTDISLYYDNDNQIQGYVTFENIEDEEDNSYYDEYRGYVIIDNSKLLSVYREPIYENGQWWGEIIGYSDWAYHGYDYETGEEYSIPFDADKVICPASRIEVWPEVTPVLTFPDLTSFYFEDYFTESAFQGLIDDYDAIIDSYYDITGQKRHSDDYYWD